MPTYEYACTNCKNQWEETQKISEPALQVCPKCSQHTAQRQISGGRFILKGGGWYADLYSSSKPGSGSSKKDESGSSGSSASGESKGDAKPAAKDSPKETAAAPKESGASSPSTPPASKS